MTLIFGYIIQSNQSRSSSMVPTDFVFPFVMCFWPYFLLFSKVNKHIRILPSLNSHAKIQLEHFWVILRTGKQTDEKTDTIIHKRVLGIYDYTYIQFSYVLIYISLSFMHCSSGFDLINIEWFVCSCSRWCCSSGSCKSLGCWTASKWLNVSVHF